MDKWVLGVDGGNSKTDFFLFTASGEFVDSEHCGTCSHEAFDDGYEGAYRSLKAAIEPMLSRNNVPASSVTAVMGLAGCDVPTQHAGLEAVIGRFGFEQFLIDNDGYLGIKAASETGIGVCSINGTGNVTVGVDKAGKRLQVGGLGYVTGDESGGGFIMTLVLRRVYDALYRLSSKTAMTEPIMKLLGISSPEMYLQGLNDLYLKPVDHKPFITTVFECADEDDEGACEVLKHVALQLAKSTAGCIKHLDFGQELDVVLAGSIWTKIASNALIEPFETYMSRLCDKECNYIKLSEPPAAGAVLWALELLGVLDIDMRARVLNAFKK